MSLPQARTNEIGYSDEVEMADHSASTTRPSKDNGMIREKFTAVADVNTENTLEDQDASLLLSKSTPADAANMRRMGKPQQLIRHFRFLSTVSFVALATAAWEIGLFVLTPGLTDGGRAGLVWNVLWNIIGFGPIYLSMAEASKRCVYVIQRRTTDSGRWQVWRLSQAHSITGYAVHDLVMKA